MAALGSGGALVDEGWATEHGLGVGDAFSITSAKGTKVALRVRAIEESPVLDILGLGPITISRQAFDGAFATERNRFTLVAGEPGPVGTALAAFPEVEVFAKDAFITKQTEWIGSILGVLWVLLALAVIVSLFGIVNTLVLATFERRRELGTLRAMGMSRRQLRRMVRHESVITALMGALPGIAVGLGLAAAVTAALSEYGLEFAVPAAPSWRSPWSRRWRAWPRPCSRRGGRRGPTSSRRSPTSRRVGRGPGALAIAGASGSCGQQPSGPTCVIVRVVPSTTNSRQWGVSPRRKYADRRSKPLLPTMCVVLASSAWPANGDV